MDEIISGLPLPAALIAAIRDGQWPGAYDKALLERVFGMKPGWPRFYNDDDLRGMNARWAVERDPAYIGTASVDTPPGDLDPRRSLLIAELEPELLIALDYRQSLADPSVVLATDELPSFWRYVADSMGALLRDLGWSL